jgi:hypothetical protein
MTPSGDRHGSSWEVEGGLPELGSPTAGSCAPRGESIIAQEGALHFVGIASSVEEATEDAARRAVDSTVAHTDLDRKEAYMLRRSSPSSQKVMLFQRRHT